MILGLTLLPIICSASTANVSTSGDCLQDGECEDFDTSLLQTGFTRVDATASSDVTIGQGRVMQPTNESKAGLPIPYGTYPGLFKTYYGQEKLDAMQEANLNCSDLSIFGAHVQKIPASIVRTITEMKKNSSKTSKYTFQGSIGVADDLKEKLLEEGVLEEGDKPPMAYRRFWIFDFAKEYFDQNDFLLITDAQESHESLGPFDYTNQDLDVFVPKQLLSNVDGYGTSTDVFDAPYFQRMINSTFTLAPGGDEPWSMRFYEAIMSGSIPVISSLENDMAGDRAFWFQYIGYTYFTTDQVVNLKLSTDQLKSIADENYALFLKYQTWIHGDQVPWAYCAYAELCSSQELCASRCSRNTTWFEKEPVNGSLSVLCLAEPTNVSPQRSQAAAKSIRALGVLVAAVIAVASASV